MAERRAIRRAVRTGQARTGQRGEHRSQDAARPLHLVVFSPPCLRTLNARKGRCCSRQPGILIHVQTYAVLLGAKTLRGQAR